MFWITSLLDFFLTHCILDGLTSPRSFNPPTAGAASCEYVTTSMLSDHATRISFGEVVATASLYYTLV